MRAWCSHHLVQPNSTLHSLVQGWTDDLSKAKETQSGTFDGTTAKRDTSAGVAELGAAGGQPWEGSARVNATNADMNKEMNGVWGRWFRSLDSAPLEARPTSGLSSYRPS